MTTKRPSGLYCIRCGWISQGLHVRSTLGKTQGFIDFIWRNLQCERCKTRMYWGEPLSADDAPSHATHMIMKSVPKAGPDGKTINIDSALPIREDKPVTLHLLILQATKAKRINFLNRWLEANKKTKDALSPNERLALKNMLERIR